jgi:hypothetical protein
MDEKIISILKVHLDDDKPGYEDSMDEDLHDEDARILAEPPGSNLASGTKDCEDKEFDPRSTHDLKLYCQHVSISVDKKMHEDAQRERAENKPTEVRKQEREAEKMRKDEASKRKDC